MPPGDNTITSADLTAAYERHPENLRELLFALFELYQARAAQPSRLLPVAIPTTGTPASRADL